jgi:hypothetical protein
MSSECCRLGQVTVLEEGLSRQATDTHRLPLLVCFFNQGTDQFGQSISIFQSVRDSLDYKSSDSCFSLCLDLGSDSNSGIRDEPTQTNN